MTPPASQARERSCWGPPHLTLVTANVETSIQGNDSHRLLLPRLRHDGPSAHRAAGGKLPEGKGTGELSGPTLSIEAHRGPSREREENGKDWRDGFATQGKVMSEKREDQKLETGEAEPRQPVEIFNAVDLAGGVHRERDAVEAPATLHASKAARVVGLPHSPQDPVQDGLRARRTLLQRGLTGSHRRRVQREPADGRPPSPCCPLHGTQRKVDSLSEVSV